MEMRLDRYTVHQLIMFTNVQQNLSREETAWETYG
jgi:hypothetical protein